MNLILTPPAQQKPALKIGEEARLTVEDVAFGGLGVARHDGLVCFVRFGAPGDVVRAVARKKKRRHRECDIVEIIEPSPLRVAPRCSHFGVCGGCRYQHIRYEEQLRIKGQHVRDCLERIGGLRDVPLLPVIGMDDPWFYRNKMEYTFGRGEDGTALGLMRAGRFDRVVDVRECFLQSPVANRLLEAVRTLVRRWGLPPFDPRSHEGFLKNLVVRTGAGDEERDGGSDGERDGSRAIMACLVTAPGDFPQVEEFRDTITRDFPEVKSLYHYANPAISGAAIGGEARLLAGAPHIGETVAGLRFRVSPESFFQVNPRQAETLYGEVAAMAGLAGGERVVDLYTGAGPIALLLARRAGEVVGVESVEGAVRDARFNAETNGITNARFESGVVEKILTEILEAEKPALLVVDPPRVGIHPRALRALLENPPPRVVYVSCNPATLARDLQAMTAEKYALRAVRPVDMFPHTAHVESVALLEAV